MKNIEISIAQVVDGGICLSTADGQRLYDAIRNEMSKGNRVTLSFHGVTRMTTAFLNAAIGQLYGEFSSDSIRSLLAPPINTEPWHLERLKKTTTRAKSYFSQSSRENVEEAYLKHMGLSKDDDI